MYERAAVLARQIDDWYALFRISMNTASKYAEAGQHDLGLAGRRMAIDATQHTGRTRDRAFAQYAYGYASMLTGDWTGARDHARSVCS